MEAEDLRRLLRSSDVDLWDLIETAVAVAAADRPEELRARRDGIVERLYAPPADRCRDCGPRARSQPRGEEKGSSSPAMKREAAPPPTPPSPEPVDEDEEEEEEDAEAEEEDDPKSYDRSIDAANRRILAIKESLEHPDQSEDSLISLLQDLADMDITFKSLQETDIGRHVNGLRKHPSNEVRGLVKHLVRKWKDLVEEWVKSNSPGDQSASPAIIADGESPQQIPRKNFQNGLQTPERGNTPHSHTDGFSSSEAKVKANPPRREAPPTKPNAHVATALPSAPPPKPKEEKDGLLDPERLASARRRLHENYQEAQNAKKQRTIQVMDIHEIPKQKNTFTRKGGFQGKHW
ncbi:probable mediator of RNA polymerase II transcription subunit 26c isoform X1 [Musa acuminata AAA Group]|uniref:probable mediator of RNA polymerase II transcription subunit 26c isoform X1 n=1 Tax=Musa acuminata AAA Group TaxID=214697 RepID=UPI0031D2B974